MGREGDDGPADCGQRVVAQLGSPRRLRTIYRANFRAAHGAGVWIRAQRTKDADPYFRYEPGPDEACAPHRVWAGTLLPIDHPWWDDHFPPNGRDCGCRVRAVGEREARRLGGPTEAPLRREVARWNEGALRFDRVDEGLDPAWATNPGKLWAEGPMGPLGSDFGPADEAYARAAIQSVLDSPILENFRATPRGDLPAGAPHREVRKELRAKTLVACLPDRIMDKQDGRHTDPRFGGHPELSTDEYRFLPTIIRSPHGHFRHLPTPAMSDEGFARRLNLVRKVRGRIYNLVLDCNSDGTKIEVISFHRVKENWVRRRLMIPEKGWDCAW